MTEQSKSQSSPYANLAEGILNSFSRLRVLAEEETINRLLAEEKTLGNLNLATINVKDQLAAIYLQRQMISEAQRYYLSVWDLRQRSLGASHPDTLNTLHSLASTYCEQEIWSTAENLERQILHMRERSLPQDNQAIIDNLCTLSWINEQMGRPAEAEKYIMRARSASESFFGKNHPFTVELTNLGSLVRQKDSMQAASQFQPGMAEQESLDDIDSVIARIHSISGVVGSTTEVDEVFKHLVEHECVNFTLDLDMENFAEAPIAGGTFGDVYRGKLRNKTPVAAKCLRVHAMDNTFKKDKAARELYYWSKIKHDNVLSLMGVAMFRGKLAMISLWMENGTIRDFVVKNPTVDRWGLCVQVATGLAHIHGDLKGKNILVSDQQVVKLSDFGNAILAECSLAFTDTTQKGGGTTRWMAPELLDEDETKIPERSKEADVYALGMTILWLHPDIVVEQQNMVGRFLDLIQRDGDGSALDDLGLHHVLPFWRNLPFANISTSITPDLLHQLHRGMTGDHLVKWMTRLVGKDRFDRWLIGLPRASGVRHFTKGKSPIIQWTGKESKQLGKVFMSVVAGCTKPEAVKAARHLLDFTYRAHLPQLSDDDPTEMEADLLAFHELKDIFRGSGAYQAPAGFKGIPKLHMLSHYVRSIRELGSPDNFNTETTELLHIEYVKDGWRTSNHVNEIPQMTRYLQRRESWVLLRIYLADIGVLPIDEDSVTPDDSPYEKQDGPISEGKSLVGDGGEFETFETAVSPNPSKRKRGGEDESGQSSKVRSDWADDLVWHPRPKVSTAKRASQCSGSHLINMYGATHLIEATRDFLSARTGSKSLHPLQGRHNFYVWARCKLEHGVIPFTPSDGAHAEVIRATPKLTDSLGRQTRYAAFDTALFSSCPGTQGLHRYTAGRVRVIFKLPAHLQHLYSNKLVYIEHFNPFSEKPHPVHGLYKTSRRMERDQPRVRYTSVVPLSKIQMACHLTPVYKREEPTDSISAASDLLSDYRRFYLNSYSSYFMFNVLNRWRKQTSVR
ncbi:Tyrosine kinase domain protein [Ceratobasidium sp. AG-Ba]|nr:Tyrosine kinase domain protein [Ceratobasidium sp. AG-Ba]